MSDMMVGLPFPADPSERFNDVLPCGCERAQGTWFYCAQHQVEILGSRPAATPETPDT